MITATNVQQTSTTTGTGNLTLAAPATGYRAFSAVMTYGTAGGTSGEDWAPYYAETADGSEWEFGVARLFNDAGNGELARSTGVVFESSNSDALVNFTGATTVRLITPPDIRNYQRGVKVSLTSTFSYSNGSAINWDAEANDTDACWSSGTPDRIYIPAWAEEVEITGFFEDDSGPFDTNTVPVAIPNYIAVAGFGTELDSSFRNEFSVPMINYDDRTTIWRAWMQCRLTVDRSSVDINSPASFELLAYANDTTSHSLSTDTFVLMRVIR